MKQGWTCIACALALCCAMGCAGQAKQTEEAPSAPVVMQTEQAEEPQAPQFTAIPAAETASPAPDEAGERNDAFRAALRALLDTHVLPDGTDAGYQEGMSDEGNQFAVYDVDGDGRDELVVLYTTTYMAGQTAGVYAFDGAGKPLRAKLTEYPLLTFYSNGVIQAGWSHNQGLAGEFWPYTLYRYDAAADAYAPVGMADAWEKAFAPVNFNGEAFPDALDAQGAGVVYYLIPGGEYQEVPPSSAAEYEAWRAQALAGAAEIALPLLPLTDESIETLR